jgi:hypothetical protein
VFPCLFGVLALFFLVVGLRGIVSKKPFLISAQWLVALVLLALAPSLLQPFLFPVPPNKTAAAQTRSQASPEGVSQFRKAERILIWARLSNLTRALREAGFRDITFYHDPGPCYRSIRGFLKACLRLWCGYFFCSPQAKNIVVARKG